MLDALFRGIARAGGIEPPADVRIVERTPRGPSRLKRLVAVFERWNVRRSTYLTLKQLDDRTLKDIGLHRGILHDVADGVGRYAAANDNQLPVALSKLAANDNEPPAKAGCG